MGNRKQPTPVSFGAIKPPPPPAPPLKRFALLDAEGREVPKLDATLACDMTEPDARGVSHPTNHRLVLSMDGRHVDVQAFMADADRQGKSAWVQRIRRELSQLPELAVTYGH